jgi:hypothetical protein
MERTGLLLPDPSAQFRIDTLVRNVMISNIAHIGQPEKQQSIQENR